MGNRGQNQQNNGSRKQHLGKSLTMLRNKGCRLDEKHCGSKQKSKGGKNNYETHCNSLLLNGLYGVGAIVKHRFLRGTHRKNLHNVMVRIQPRGNLAVGMTVMDASPHRAIVILNLMVVVFTLGQGLNIGQNPSMLGAELLAGNTVAKVDVCHGFYSINILDLSSSYRVAPSS